MSANSFLYFAYGSNMPAARLRARCPSARAIGIAELPGHELRWHKVSIDKSGKCDVVTSEVPIASVFGVLYEIDANEKDSLDNAEGKGYEAIEIEVLSGTQVVSAVLYRAKAISPALRPYTWYRALVIAGAKEHGLPALYIAGLESVPADQDPDRTRHDERMALIEGVRA